MVGARMLDRRSTLMLISGVIVLIAGAIFAILAGSSGVGLPELLLMLQGKEAPGLSREIILYVRLPRLIAAAGAGGALAVAGLLLQVILGNILASPSVLGMNASAGFTVVLAAIIAPLSVVARFGAAFIGSYLAAIIVFMLARNTGETRRVIILAGVAITSLFSAGTQMLITFFPDAVFDKQAFTVGGFANAQLEWAVPFTLVIVAALAVSLLLGPRLDVLLLGDEVAGALGLNVKQVRTISLMLSALLAACAVSLGGLLSFIGLMVPHALRKVVGNQHRALLPLCAVWGAAFLIVCDTLARIIFAPFDFPVGLILALLGAPFFLSLILRREGGRRYTFGKRLAGGRR